MRRAWALLALGLTGCLALVNHDGPWPCNTDADCASGETCKSIGGQPATCYAPGTCQGDLDCQQSAMDPNAVCTAGKCACPQGWITCGGVCTYTQSDTNNCGACGTTCNSQEQCFAGACTCNGGLLLCGGACVDQTSDPNNCGKCGDHCAKGGMCSGGACACPTGQSACSGVCVDEQTDASNCGACGTKCTVKGQQCTAGACSCPAGDRVCPSGCSDLQTDASNCGTCGVACSGTCAAGRCLQTLASGINTPLGIAVDDTNVYVSVWGDGTIVKLPKNGGTVTTLASGLNGPMSMAIDATNVYWADYMGGDIMQVPIAGGTPTTIASGQGSNVGPVAVGTQVFWMTGEDSTTGVGQVLSAPIGGGSAPTVWESGLAYTWGLEVNGPTVYWTASAYLQWTSTPGSKLGGPNAELACAIRVSGGYVYWTNSMDTDAVMTMPSASPLTPTVLATGAGNVIRQSLVVDGMNAYWSESTGDILKVPLAGGIPVTLTTLQEAASDYNPDVQRIAVDATSLYFTNGNTNEVTKLTPK